MILLHGKIQVTARIRKPENGLYTGVIDAVDTSDNTYRITFDRHGIGTHSIPDYEVLVSTLGLAKKSYILSFESLRVFFLIC